MLLVTCNVKSEGISQLDITMHYETNRIVEIHKNENGWVIALTKNKEEGNTLVRVKVIASLPVEQPYNWQFYNWQDCRFLKSKPTFNPMETPIVGLLGSDRKEGLITPKRAWLVNYLKETIVELDINNVICDYVEP